MEKIPSINGLDKENGYGYLVTELCEEQHRGIGEIKSVLELICI